MLPALSPERRHLNELREHIVDIAAELDELRPLVPSINDPDLHEDNGHDHARAAIADSIQGFYGLSPKHIDV